MKNTKKIFALLVLSILFKTQNVKPISKKAMGQIHFITSVIAILPSIIPDSNGEKKWYNPFNNHTRWENLSIKKPILDFTKIPEEAQAYLGQYMENNIALEFYTPTVFNQILAASIDKDLDIVAELIENTKKMKMFIEKIDKPQDSNFYVIFTEYIVTASEITSKAVARNILTKLFKSHKISKRLAKIITLSALDVAGSYARIELEKRKNEDPYFKGNKIITTAVASSIAKNIIIETLGEVIQRVFIDDEKTKNKKYLHNEIQRMMNNNESALKLKTAALKINQ